jgi:hypothetical protein
LALITTGRPMPDGSGGSEPDVAGDAGVHTFLVTLKSSDTQTRTATDTHTGSIKGSASVKVS